MTDHAISYIKCVSVPSENIKTQSKKNIEIFLKDFKKRRRNLLTKLNKNQISTSQVIQYYNENIDLIKKIKYDRLQKIILLTQEFMENISDDEQEHITDGTNKYSMNIEEDSVYIINNVNKIDEKPLQFLNEKIIDENQSIQIEQMEIDLVPHEVSRNSISDVMEIIEEDEEHQKEVDFQYIKTTKIDKIQELDEQYENASSGMESSPEFDKTFDVKIVNRVEDNKTPFQTDSIKSLAILNQKPSTIQANSKLFELNTNLNASKLGPPPNRLPVKNSQIKTPQQPLYKSKFHPTAQGSNSMSKWKSNSLVKSQTNLCSGSTSQTLSSQKKPLTEIRKQQDRIEEDKRRKLEEIKAKRKENCMKLAEINESKKVANSLKSKTNYSSMKPGIPNQSATLPAGSSLKAAHAAGLPSSLPQRPIIASSQSQKSTTATLQRKQNPIDKFPMFPLASNQMANAMKPINCNPHGKANVISSSNTTGSQSSCVLLPEFKTPFSKQRLTILSDSCKKIIDSHESYDLSGLVDVDSDEDEDEENQPKSRIPRWSRKENGTLEKLVRYQMKHSNPSDIILEARYVRIDYSEVFGEDTTIEPGVLEAWL